MSTYDNFESLKYHMFALLCTILATVIPIEAVLQANGRTGVYSKVPYNAYMLYKCGDYWKVRSLSWNANGIFDDNKLMTKSVYHNCNILTKNKLIKDESSNVAIEDGQLYYLHTADTSCALTPIGGYICVKEPIRWHKDKEHIEQRGEDKRFKLRNPAVRKGFYSYKISVEGSSSDIGVKCSNDELKNDYGTGDQSYIFFTRGRGTCYNLQYIDCPFDFGCTPPLAVANENASDYTAVIDNDDNDSEATNFEVEDREMILKDVKGSDKISFERNNNEEYDEL